VKAHGADCTGIVSVSAERALYARYDVVTPEHLDQFVRANRIATNGNVDVGREPSNAVRNDRNAADDHPRRSALGQRSRERVESVF
jgi:hypothetical protein